MKKESWMYSDTKVKNTKKDLSKLPDPKKHQMISFVKSGIRMVGYAALPLNLGWAVTFLVLSEAVGIIEELV